MEYVRRTLVPALGGSVTIGDFNGDGHPDLYIVVPGGSNHLFRNNGNGTFADVTVASQTGGTGGSLSATFADYDRSGRPSLFVAGMGGVRLYHNRGDGTFADRTLEAGLQGKPGDVITRAVLADLDGDGFQDLLLTSYTDLGAPPSTPLFVFPNDFAGSSSRLYRNTRRGVFIDVTDSSGLAWNTGRARGAVVADVTSDARPDLLVLRDNKPPILYLNQGGWKFQDGTWDAGEPISRNAFVDAQAADFDRDGRLDLALWSTQGNRVLLNCGGGRFEQAELRPVIAPPASPFGFRGAVADLNGDGFKDLLALDSAGNWRFFANRAGRFQEAPFTLSSKLGPVDSVTPATLEGRLYLLALQSDGRIAVLERQEAPTNVKAK